MKKIFLVNYDYINSRLDRWFKKNVCDVPQSLIEKNIRKGNIKINYKNEKSSYKLKEKDKIIIYNVNFIANKHKKINEPAGIAVQSGTKSRRNILDMLRSTKEFEGSLPYAVHRIDKETTGVFIVAKNRKYAQLFTSLFRIRKIHKTYLGIVLGQPEKNKGTLKDDLLYYENKKKIKTSAITHYTVLDNNNNYSLLKLNPETGKKHQLRKQLLIHGNPILGDTKYRISENYPSKKNTLMLHAYKINFSINGIKYNFSAEPPLAFKNILKEKYLKIF